MSEKKKQDWSRVPGRIWAFIYFLGFCIFSGVVIRANVLPGKYLYPILTVSGIISIVLLMMLCSRKLKRGWKITAFVLSFLMAGIVGYAGVHLDWLAQLMKERGCVEALNLDGGQTATMFFNGKIIETGDTGLRSQGSLICFGTME